MLFIALLLLEGVSAVEENAFSIPPVVYVPNSVLKLYGLNDVYDSEPAERPTNEELKRDWEGAQKVLEKMLRQNKHITFGTFVKTLSSIENNSTRSYFEWATAHTLNFIFLAGIAVRDPLNKMGLDFFHLAMGEPRCPTTPKLQSLFPKACNKTLNYITERESVSALYHLNDLAKKGRFWLKLIRDIALDKLKIKSKRVPKILTEIQIVASISPKFTPISEAYFSVYKREAEFFESKPMATTTEKPEESDELEETDLKQP